MTRSTPSPSTLRSKSVTRAATSIRASAVRSRPVISQSIHTSRSLTRGHPTDPAPPRKPAQVLASSADVQRPRLGSAGVKEWFGTLARLVVGGVWLVAGLLKVSDGAASVRAVRAYDLLPEAVVPTVGHALPAFEIVIGLALVAGALTRAAAVASSLLFVAFIIGIASAWARGLQIECGCFGGGGFDADATDKYPVGDRPRRRPAPAVPLAGLATPHQAGARLLHLPSRSPPRPRESDHVEDATHLHR